ncbi:MAG TPA: serine/threonine-protein kinase [Pseudomonadota bacterium]|nr:serine/threonine-protein kinase [Pseudomonadota bacterium]
MSKNAIDATDAMDAMLPTQAAPMELLKTQAADSSAADEKKTGELFTTAKDVPREITVLPLIEQHGERIELVRKCSTRYETLKPLGKGGMGEVSLVRDNDIGRTVARKRLLLSSSEDSSALLRFVAEVRTVGQLEHPNIVPIHDVGLDENGNYYFVMKYVDGETLEHIIHKLADGDPDYHQRYPVEVRLTIFMGLLRALQYAHDQGVVHRDLKPANVMVGRYGEVMLMDFGVAKRIRGAEPTGETQPAPEKAETLNRLFATRNDQLIGTPAYMSPEQAMGKNDAIDERSDLYSASVLLHEFLALRHYLSDKLTLNSILMAIATENFGYWQLIFVRHPKHPVPRSDLLHYVAKGLEKDPNARYQSAFEMIAELQQITEGRCAVRCPATLAKRMTYQVISFVEQFPKLSPFLFFPLLLFVLYAVYFTLSSAFHS